MKSKGRLISIKETNNRVILEVAFWPRTQMKYATIGAIVRIEEI